MRFRRRSGDDTAPTDLDDVPLAEPRGTGDAEPSASPVPERPRGPWDVADLADEVTRVDFGALLVPAVDGMEVRLDLDEQGGVSAVGVALDETVLQLQPFAAPRSSGLWDEVRAEMVEGIRSSGGTVDEADGPFGKELRARLEAQGPDGKVVGREPVRFLGVDGPRWFLRAVITGAGAGEPARADAVHAVLRGVAVVRGEEAAPPRELLELKVPEDPQLQAGPAAGG